MKNKIIIAIWALVAIIGMGGCSKDYPMDENNLLITNRTDCSINNFNILGSDRINALVGTAVIDQTKGTITAVAKFGTNLKNVKPYCSASTDAILAPTMDTWVDFSQPREYTVISGNRKEQKKYVITITVQN